MSRFLLNGQDLYGNAPQTGDKVSVVDTEGIVGQAGSTTNSQALFDGVAGDLCDVKTDLSDFEDDVDDTLHEYHVVPSKNLCPFHSQTISGIPFVADSDGYLTCSVSDTRPWTYSSANEQITLKAGTYKVRIFEKTARTSGYIGFTIHASDDTVIMENITTDLFETLLTQDGSFTLAVDTAVGIEIKVGNGAYAVEIVKSDDNTIPYEPYWVCMRDGMFPRSEQMVLGAKNIMPFPYVTNPGTFDGASFSVNSKGQITVTATSTTGYGQYALTDYITDNRYAGMILSSGQPYSDNCYMRIREALSDGTYVREWSVDGELTIPTMESGHKYFIAVRCGVIGVAVNKVFSPMISYDGGEFAPFAMTNRELTDKFTNRFVKIAEAAANQTWATQISVLNSAYSNLTTAQKMRACISNNEDFADGMFTLAAKNVATFGLVSISGTGEFAIMSIRLSSNKISRLNCPVGGSVTVTDMSSQTNNMKLILYVEN